MKTNFGDKALRQAMMNDPLLRGKWEEAKPTHALNPVDHLIAKLALAWCKLLRLTIESIVKSRTNKTRSNIAFGAYVYTAA